LKPWIVGVVFAAGVLAGCMADSPPVPAQAPETPPSPLGTPFAERRGRTPFGNPLIVDRMDMRLGTTVHFERIPTAGELHDQSLLLGLAHIVVALPAWPEDFAQLQPLDQIPQGADCIVILPGYPPSRAAAEAWGYLSAELRIIVVVAGPPPSIPAVQDLNAMRRLERVIAQMEEPSRAGFERLQRPLQFRKIIE
jgi:hypothetical protein